MAPHEDTQDKRPGAPSTAELCMGTCRAGCCQGPAYLPLAAAEVRDFAARALRIGSTVRLRLAADGTAQVRFPEHPGDRCPMLDPATFACRIYETRPARCRAFPEAPRPGCPLSELLHPRRPLL
ncbi:MAG TPA: YkgJ family cysteine cluster protein [Myxococcota bacterium]|nr:YkgJ family cysteine cluster protein [Myxococcota bacterium]